EPDACLVRYDQLDRSLVVQDHLGFPDISASSPLAELQKVLGIQPGVGVPFQATGGPRQIDQQAAQDVPRESAGWTAVVGSSSQVMQPVANHFGQVPGSPRPVAGEPVSGIADRPTAADRPTD